MKKTKETNRMENNNKRLETMVKTILEWEGDFDSLANKFDGDDCLFLLENTQFRNDYTIDNIYDVCEEEDWYSFMIYYIIDLLLTSIEKGIKRYTDNLYRLWFETV